MCVYIHSNKFVDRERQRNDFAESFGNAEVSSSLFALQELNSAIEFTSIYEVLLPIVQTLPQLILHKEKIMDTLLSNLRLNAIHSLGPILR